MARARPAGEAPRRGGAPPPHDQALRLQAAGAVGAARVGQPRPARTLSCTLPHCGRPPRPASAGTMPQTLGGQGSMLRRLRCRAAAHPAAAPPRRSPPAGLRAAAALLLLLAACAAAADGAARCPGYFTVDSSAARLEFTATIPDVRTPAWLRRRLPLAAIVLVPAPPPPPPAPAPPAQEHLRTIFPPERFSEILEGVVSGLDLAALTVVTCAAGPCKQRAAVQGTLPCVLPTAAPQPRPPTAHRLPPPLQQRDHWRLRRGDDGAAQQRQRHQPCRPLAAIPVAGPGRAQVRGRGNCRVPAAAQPAGAAHHPTACHLPARQPQPLPGSTAAALAPPPPLRAAAWAPSAAPSLAWTPSWS